MKTKIASLAAATFAVATIGAGQAFGITGYFAVMLSNGIVARSSGVAAAARTAIGKYEITFNGSIAGCATLVNVTGAAPAWGVGRRKPGTTDVLQVSTFSRTGAATDLPFHLLISCNS
jgi:hypothetical protein